MEGAYPGFTPVRRREDSYATKRRYLDDGKAWTTARCNRLLRPLISKVSALGRLLPSENTVTDKISTIYRTKKDDVRDEDSMREDDDDEDDEWAPVKKKMKRTYSARLGKGTRGRPPKSEKRKSRYSDLRHRMPFLVPGELSIPTPILNRAKGGPDFDAPISSSFNEILGGKGHKRPKSRYLTKDGDAHFELSEILRDLRRRTKPSRYSLYEGIYNGLEVLLKATMAETNPTMQDRTGVRSLFTTCLRKVPEVIREEEELLALEEGDRSAMETKDVSSEIYAELEDLGHGDRGWRHLRTVVRAHGIQIVGDAITQGLLKSDSVRALVLLCVHTACLDEAENLLSCLLQVTTFPEPRSFHSRTCDESSMIPLSVLDKFACYTGRRPFQLRQLTGLFLNEQLPLAWLATKEFGCVWNHAIKSSASDPDSSTFLTTLLPKLCSSGTKPVNFALTEGVMLKALDATFGSVLTALSAIKLLNTPMDDIEVAPSVVGGPQKQSTALRQSLITCASVSSPLNEHRGSLLAFANLLTSPEYEVDKSDLFEMFSTMMSFKQTQKLHDSIASFTCSVAFCCGRGAYNSGFQHLKLLHSRLRNYLTNQACSNKRMIREVIIDSAFKFARRNDESEHLDYAEDIESEYHEEHMTDQPRRLPTEAVLDISAGFRWEEGISEWVTATPAFSLKRGAVIPDSEDELDSDSPSRPNPRPVGRPSAVPRRSIIAVPEMFTQVTKHVQASSSISKGGQQQQEEKPSLSDRVIPRSSSRKKQRLTTRTTMAISTSSESEDDLVADTSLDVSFTSLSSHHFSAVVSSSQSSNSTDGGGERQEKKSHLTRRVLRPRTRSHGLIAGHTESDDDLVADTSLDVSFTSLSSHHFSALVSSSQSSRSSTDGGIGERQEKKSQLMTRRILRPRTRSHGLIAGHTESDDDDELSSFDDKSDWDALIRRNKIAVVINTPGNGQEKEDDGGSHRYSTRGKSTVALPSKIPPPPKTSKRRRDEIDDSEDELCL